MNIPISAVIDTSVIMSAFMSPLNTGASFAILENFVARKNFIWIMSQSIYDEYHKKLVLKFDQIQKRAATKGVIIEASDIDDIMSFLAKNCRWAIDPPVKHGITLDPNDDNIATLAIDVGVHYLVTLDNDYAPMLQGDYLVKVVKPSEFIQILRVVS